MKESVISYLITFGVLIMGIGAAWLIIHIANADTATTIIGNEGGYGQLKQSLLNTKPR